MLRTFAVNALLIVATTLVAPAPVWAQGPLFSPEPTASALAGDDDLRDFVLFAGGTVEFRLPLAWKTAEVPQGRQVRLELWPEASRRHMVRGAQSPLVDGAWLTFHYRDQRHDATALRQMLVRQIEQTLGEPQDAAMIESIEHGPFRGVRQAFVQDDAQGFHLLIATEPGILELHFVAPRSAHAERMVEIDALLASMKLVSPVVPQQQVVPQLADAEQVVGLWKSLRGSMRLTGQGQVVVRFDRTGVFPIDERGHKVYDRGVTRLAGQYTAQDDLILITWGDGSRLNYRWTIDKGELLLTDHLGRVSQMNRILE